MIRIAVCLSGQIRTWEKCLHNIKRFYESASGTQVDYFYHTWEKNETVQEFAQRDCPVLEDVPKETIDTINEILNPKDYSVTPTLTDQFKKECYHDRWLNLFYSLSSSIQLKKKYEIENNFTYDLVIKARFDIIYNPNIHIFAEELHMPKLCMVTSHCSSFPLEYFRYNFNDVAFFGSSLAMDMISSMCQVVVRRLHQISNGTEFTELYDAPHVGPGVSLYKFMSLHGIRQKDKFHYHEYIIRTLEDETPNTLEGYLYYVDKHKEWYIR